MDLCGGEWQSLQDCVQSAWTELKQYTTDDFRLRAATGARAFVIAGLAIVIQNGIMWFAGGLAPQDSVAWRRRHTLNSIIAAASIQVAFVIELITEEQGWLPRKSGFNVDPELVIFSVIATLLAVYVNTALLSRGRESSMVNEASVPPVFWTAPWFGAVLGWSALFFAIWL